MTAFSNNTIKTKATKAKSPIHKRRPRRELPEDLTDLYIDGEGPSPLDVVGGRGGVSNNHEGNKRYWRRILSERPGYKQLGKHDNAKKTDIAQGIYDYIVTTGGRFLQLDSKTQKWFNLPQKIGLDKIKQALRDKYVPNFIEGEPIAKVAAPLSAPTEGEKKQFWAFLNQAPDSPQADFVSSTPSIDLGPILSQASFDLLNLMTQPSIDKMENAWSKFPSQNKNTMKSFEFSLRDHSLDNLLRGDMIATRDNMAPSDSRAPQPPKALQALLQQQMESAIPSYRTFAAV
jgi:hypothetical protein